MYDKELENEIRAQEIALFGGCLEDPKYSFGQHGVGFSPSRDTRQPVICRTDSLLGEKVLFEMRIDYKQGECIFVPIKDGADDAKETSR